MRDEETEGCSVDGCVDHASERAPRVFFCAEHWAALCDAYARHCAVLPATSGAPAAPRPAA